MFEADIRVVAEATCSDGVPIDFYWDQKIKVPFNFCYEIDEDGNIASEIDIGSYGASIDTASYGLLNEPECTGGSEDCIFCSAERPSYEIEKSKSTDAPSWTPWSSAPIPWTR